MSAGDESTQHGVSTISGLGVQNQLGHYKRLQQAARRAESQIKQGKA